MTAEYERNGEKTGGVIFCINILDYSHNRGEEGSHMSTENINSALMSEGLHPAQLPKIINNEVLSQERVEMYNSCIRSATNTVFLITARILIVDLLDNKIDPMDIKGFLVPHAHKINEFSMEAFILRVYRDKNPSGFIKAFTEEPENLTSSSHGSLRLIQILKLLYLRKVYLYPRSHTLISTVMSGAVSSGSKEADQNPSTPSQTARDEGMESTRDDASPSSSSSFVEEINIGLSRPMKAIQTAILAAMRICLTEVKKCTSNIGALDDLLSFEKGMLFNAGLDGIIRRTLEPDWHRISHRSKALLSDLADLRKLLDYLLRYDAFTFYYFLLKLKKSSMNSTDKHFTSNAPAFWLTTPAAEQIFLKAKERVYKILTRDQYEKALALSDSSSKQGPERKKTRNPVSYENYLLYPIIEVPPKWRILRDVIKEARASYHSYKASIIDTNGDEGTTNTDGRIIDDSESMIKPVKRKRIPKHRVMIIVKDELTASQIQDNLTYTEDIVCDQRYRWFISQQAAEIRQISATSTTLSNGQAVPLSEGSKKRPKFGHGNANMQDAMTSIHNQAAMMTTGSSTTTRGSDNNMDADMNPASNYMGLKVSQREYEPLSAEQKLILIEEKSLLDIANNVGESFHTSSMEKEYALSQSISGQNQIERDKFDDSDSGEMEDDNDSVVEIRPTQKRKLSQISNGKSNSKKTIAEAFKAISDSRDSSNRVDDESNDVESHGFYFDVPTAPSNDSPSGGCAVRESSDEMIFIVTHNEAHQGYYNIIDEMQPDRIIMYDADVTLIRMIESHQANRQRLKLLRQSSQMMDLKVFFLMYDDSAELQRYIDTLEREKKAFETLSSLQQHGMISSISLPDNAAVLMEAKAHDQKLYKDSRLMRKEQEYTSHENSAVNEQDKAVATLEDTSESALRDAANAKRVNNPINMMVKDSRSYLNIAATAASKPIVVVDVREFRSPLPSLLHSSGFQIVPRTLSVGDYVIGADIAVERKGITDLFQSFASGRLYNQVEAMSKYYKSPCLLIEFSPEKSFSLQAASDITPDIQSYHISSRISILTLSFPALRILWSRSPHETSNIFRSLMHGQEPVDIVKAINAGSLNPVDVNTITTETSTSGKGNSNASFGNDEMIASQARLTAQEMLLSLPGVNVHNYRSIISHISTLSDLVSMTEEDLISIMGSACAKKLFQFLTKKS